jgi:hypothetical protein
VPVVGTTVAVALLALPLVALGRRPGLELVFPLAVVLLGGLVTTMLVTLFWVPAAYRHFAPAPARQDLADSRQTGSADGPGSGRLERGGNGQHHVLSGNEEHPDRELTHSSAASGQAQP